MSDTVFGFVVGIIVGIFATVGLVAVWIDYGRRTLIKNYRLRSRP